MAGVPPIPPLLCNTPPPIDFGEDDDDSGLPSTLTLEDDEYGDFALASDINEDATNADASSLPHTPLQFELSSSTTSGFTDVPPVLEDCGTTPLQPELKSCAAQKETETKVQLNEAINYDVTRKLSAECYRSQTTDAINELDEIDVSLGVVAPPTQKVINDNKQDNFDSNDAKIYTAHTESLPTLANPIALKTERESRKENTSILANEQDIKIKAKIKPDISQSQPVTGIVLIEDLADDSSDEECHRSPKKSSISPTSPLTSADDIVSADFFAIHVVDATSSPKEEKSSALAEDINMNNFSNHNNNVINDLEIPTKDNGTEEYNDDFGDFADFESVADYIKPVSLPLVTSDVIAVPIVDSNENVEAVDEPPTDNGTLANNDNDDFDDFQDFCVAPTPVPTLTPFISAQNSLDSVITNNDSIKKNVDLKEDSVASSNAETTFQKKEIENDDDDDDDFGDFEKASLVTPSHELTPNAIISHAYPPTVSSGNINERLSSVLKIMFPSKDVGVADDFQSGSEAKVPEKLPGLQSPNTTLPFESIETAKALEFQWPQSEMRHALIRSIGIDSRNILFGENWNPSMPRFAANLSFNPLKPMKPQTANTTTTSFADAESLHYNNSSSGSAADVDIGSYAMKTDVPEVEFDWQSAGLVNPLDASHVHTLLLDLDQVMVMAHKLDNLTVDSSFSACATLEQITSTTTPTTTTSTTANYKLTNQMQRLNLIPFNTQTTTTTITTPALVPCKQLSSSPPSSSSSLLICNNLIATANSTPISCPNATQHDTNTLINTCTYQIGQTNAPTNCNTTHATAGRHASHSPNIIDAIHSLVSQRPAGNVTTTIEPLMYLKKFTNHFSAITQNHTPAMINNNTNNYNKNNSINSNSTDRFPMTTLKPCISAPTLIYGDAVCNDNNVLINNPLGCANFDMKTNRLPDRSWVKGEANSREAETIHPPPPVARLDTPDDQRQSHTAFTNIGDNISETLSNNDTEMTATPTKDICPAPLTLDKATYQLTIQEQGITTTSNSSCASLSSNTKPYDNSKTLTALRLGGNIVDEDDDDDGTVVTSTYAGPLKETHIYTPSKTELATAGKTSKATASGSEPIDFDYEIAAAGIIIDEKVVKKEYRDVEYNPGFSLEMVNEYAAESPIGMPAPLPSEPILLMAQTQAQQQQQKTSAEVGNDEFSEFTEFQSVPPPPQVSVPVSITASVSRVEPHSKVTNISFPPVLPAAIAKAKEASNTPSRTNSPSIIDNMILSPAILLPQAIPISANNTSATKAPPSIEWGDTSANINADELARIEELFPQPKMTAAKDANSSQKASPTHNYVENKAKNASISISASIAMKEQDSTLNDDYWSEFVSVPVTPQLSSNASRLNNNNNSCNINMKGSNNNNQPAITPKRVVDAQINSANNSNKTMRSPHHQQHSNVQRTLTPTLQRKPTPHTSLSTSSNICNTNSNINSNSNDDDWSDYVSSTPAPTHVNSYMRTVQTPQFNSAAWQNANFYNNPLGLYHQQATILTRSAPLTSQQQQLQLQQQIHIMQDFSTAPVTARPNVTINNSNNAHISNMQHSNSYSPLQVGNARVAPSISLIPDLGFVAPAIPVHTAFVNVLPKTSFNGKK